MIVDRLTKHIDSNLTFSIDLGMKLPKVVSLRNLSWEEREAILIDSSYEEIIPGRLLRQKMGEDMTFGAWVGGGRWHGLTCTVTDPYLIAHGRGPKVRAACVTSWGCSSDRMAGYFDRVSSILAEQDKDFTGLVSLDVSHDGEEVYYHGIRFGERIESLYSLSALAGMEAREYVKSMAEGIPVEYNGFGIACALWAYPYSLDDNFGIQVEALRGEECFYEVGRGTGIAKAWESMARSLESSMPDDVLFRKDGDILPRRIFKMLKQTRFLN